MHLELIWWFVTAITVGVTSARDYLKHNPIAPVVLWVMPRGGVTNHIEVKRKSSFIGHTLFSIAPLPISNTPASVLIPLMSSSLPFRTTNLTFFPLLPNLIFFWCHTSKDEHFLPFSCPVAVNDRKKQEYFSLKIYQGFGSQAPLLQYITTGLGMDDYCQMRRLESVYLTAW